MRIRLATTADVSTVVSLVQRAYEGYVEQLGIRPAPLDEDYGAQIDDGLVWVAEDRAVVGLIVLVVMSDHLLVENVAVAPERHGEGVGRALLAHAESSAHRAGLSELRLYTNAGMTRNIEFYRRLGYREVRRGVSGPFHRVHFSKPVA